MRRRRLRRLALASLLRDQGGEEEEDEGEDEGEDEEGNLMRLLVGRRGMRRRSLRRLALAS
jgi:hypothetical protein